MVAIRVTPARLVLKAMAHFMVIEIFVLMTLQVHFPRYRRLFSPIEWLLWDIPTDAEYALEQYTKAERAGHSPVDPFDSESQSQVVPPSETDYGTAAPSTIATMDEEDQLIDPFIQSFHVPFFFSHAKD